jgi:hypothetical protein
MGSLASPIAPVVRGLPRTGASLPNALGAANDIVPGPRGFGRIPSIPTTPQLPPAPTLPVWEPPIPVGNPIFTPNRGVPSPIIRAPGIGRPLLAPGGAIAGAERAALNRGLARAVRGAGTRVLARRVAGFAARGIPYVGWGLTAYELGRFGYDLYRRLTEPDTMGMPQTDGTPAPFPFGQCETLYRIGVRVIGSINGQPFDSGPTTGIYNGYPGPMTFRQIPDPTNPSYPALGQFLNAAGQVLFSDGLFLPPGNITSATPVFTRMDGLPDDCAVGEPDPSARPSPNPLTDPYPRPLPDGIPSPYPDGLPFPLPDPLTNPDGSPFPGLDGLPFPFPVPDGWPVPDWWPYPDGLPFPLPDPLPEPNPGEPGSPPTPEFDCCAGLTLELGNNSSDLDRVLDLLEAHGKGIFDLAPCESEIDPLNPPDPLAGLYEGEGLTGVYAAIAAITKSLNLVRADTKCIEINGSNAALPMHFEARHGEIPQLVVIWRKIDGGGSTWSMTIPHPRDEIGPDYVFSFPEYRKGGNMASLRLADNSQVIVNVFSEPEANKILDYITTLIDPDFIPEVGLKMVYSQNVAEYAEVDIRAQYVKKYQGHRTAAPLWGQHIPS